MSASACPACGRGAAALIERLDVAAQHAFYAPADPALQQRLTAAAAPSALQYAMLRCSHCGLEFSSPLRAPSGDWYRLVYQTLDLYPAARWEFDAVLPAVQPGQRLLEIGCGSGAFLEQCRLRGLDASGVDFSAHAIELCLARGLRARQLDLAAPPGADLPERVSHIAAFHVLEHLDRPQALFEYARCLALPVSHLWLSMPSDRRPSRRFGQSEFLDQPPHHMTRWTPAALAAIGARHLWRLAEVRYEPLAMPLAVRWITILSPSYRRWEAAGRLRNRSVERGFRALIIPFACLRWLAFRPPLSGHSMLAHFILEAGPSNPDGAGIF